MFNLFTRVLTRAYGAGYRAGLAEPRIQILGALEILSK
jgi:hypothetical protein